METQRSGLARCRCWWRASARSRCPAMIDLEDRSLSVHATVGVLSQKMPTWQYWSECGAMCSSTSQAKRTPAISRSEFVILPLGFDVDTRFLMMSGGKAILQTIGFMCEEPLNHTLPAPKAHASTYPTKCGVPGHNSKTDVGLDPMRLSSVIQS